MKQSQSFSNSSCTDQIHLAERELLTFTAAVPELFGVEQAGVSPEDWLEELEPMDVSPRSMHRDWRMVTIAASVRLANRLNGVLKHRTALGTSKTGTEVSFIPSSNCSDHTDDHTIFGQIHENSIR